MGRHSRDKKTIVLSCWRYDYSEIFKVHHIQALMVGEHEIMLLYHLGCVHQEITNHQGLDVMHFEYLRIVIPPAAQYEGFPVSGVSPQKS